jgi:hypothetical protein
LSQLISVAGETWIVLDKVSGGGTSPILGPPWSAIANELPAKIPRKQTPAKMILKILITHNLYSAKSRIVAHPFSSSGRIGRQCSRRAKERTTAKCNRLPVRVKAAFRSQILA